MQKQKKKLAVLRDNQGLKCPFGLTIDKACKTAGKSVLQMTELASIQGRDYVPQEEFDRLTEINKVIYANLADGTRCPFADQTLGKDGMVNCNHGQTNEGFATNIFQTGKSLLDGFYGFNFDALYGHPLRGGTPMISHFASIKDEKEEK